MSFKRQRNEEIASVPTSVVVGSNSGIIAGSKVSKKRATSSTTEVDLDAIFSGLGAKKTAAADAAARAVTARAADAADAARAAAKNRATIAALEVAGRAANSGGRPDSPVALRFDSELGVRVFSVAGLKIGSGQGNTKDCPFDCDCCY